MSGIVAKIVLLQLCNLAAALPMLEKGGQILEQQGWWISIVVNLFLVLLMVLISGLYAGNPPPHHHPSTNINVFHCRLDLGTDGT